MSEARLWPGDPWVEMRDPLDYAQRVAYCRHIGTNHPEGVEMSNTKLQLTSTDLDTMLQDDGYEGFGYLGGRRDLFASYGLSAVAAIIAADEAVLDVANARGWTYDQLFTWANSKNGRWFADVVFGSGPFPATLARLTAAAKYL